MAAAATCNPSSAFLLFLLSCPASLGTRIRFCETTCHNCHIYLQRNASVPQCINTAKVQEEEGAEWRSKV